MVDVQGDFLVGFTTAFALIVVSFKDVFSDFWRNGNSRGFGHIFRKVLSHAEAQRRRERHLIKSWWGGHCPPKILAIEFSF
jgi:hypothetical protein